MRVLSTFLAALVLVTGCAHSTAPKDWLPEAVEATQDTHGGWILLRLADKSEHEGELIAIHADSVFVLEPVGLSGYAHVQIQHAVLTGYDSQWKTIASWAVLGSVATLSHGWGLVFSLPVWILVGTTAAASQSVAGRVTVTPASWEEARKDARFPQGLPESLDRAALLPRNPAPVTQADAR